MTRGGIAAALGYPDGEVMSRELTRFMDEYGLDDCDGLGEAIFSRCAIAAVARPLPPIASSWFGRSPTIASSPRPCAASPL